MLVRELMTSPVVTVAPGTHVKDAAEVLVANDITAAPVVDASGRLVGIVSEIDLIRREVGRDPRAHLRRVSMDATPPPRTVADVMTVDVVAVPPGLDVADVVTVMVESGVKSVPVVDDDRPVGMLSRRDVLRVLTRDDAMIRHEVERRLRGQPGGDDVEVVVDEGIVRLVVGDGLAELTALARVASTVPGVVRVEPRERRFVRGAVGPD